MPVLEVKRVPTSKKGYFSKFVIKISPTNPKPNLAPAVVDDNRCEPPIAAPANKIPGPKLFCIACLDKYHCYHHLKRS